MFIW
jgi:glycosyl transferase family 25